MRGVPAARIWAADTIREREIIKHHDLKIHWECEIQERLRNDPAMCQFFKDLIIYVRTLFLPSIFQSF